MTRLALLAGGTLLAITSTLALASPEEPTAPAVSEPPPVSTPVVQDTPRRSRSPSSTATERFSLPPGFPSLSELEAMDQDELDELLGLRPKFDIPAAARRSLNDVGLLDQSEGGFAPGALAGQPEALVRAALAANRGPLVSRWGHVLLRRALASRLDAPRGMDPVQFAALRANALNAMGESAVARALVQDVDGSNYNRALTDAAFDAYLGTGDVLGLCPIARLQPTVREDPEWELLRAICSAYSGETRNAERTLDRAFYVGLAPGIDVLLAQRYAGAAADGGRAVNIEWDEVEELTPWRFAMARALGIALPENLRGSAGAQARFDLAEAVIPASPLLARIAAADRAGARGALSSAAMVDLYSQLYASDAYETEQKAQAALLREAYIANTAAARLAAMRELWGADADYGRQVLTAYAAARLPVNEAMVDDAGPIVASMLAAGLDRNALLWGEIVPEGSQAWALLALAAPARSDPVDSGAVDDFMDEDASADQRKTAFLVAGLAGLGRLDPDDLADYGETLGVNFARESAWSRKIGRAAQVENAALVALLAGVGMQGEGWAQMTPRQLYHIVSALNRVGLSAEARMIAAEAVARG